jgi:ribosomal protein S18 acetylase RimI-like enzyme
MEQLNNLRPSTLDDEQFLYRLYASTREDELAVVPWSESEKETFLTTQFNAQHTFYHQQFNEAEFLIIEQDNEPIGRLYLDHRDDEIRIVDIALLPSHRNRGIGTKYLETILEEGQGAGLPVRIHVERNNTALRLYERLGFQKVTENGVYFLMEKWPNKDPGG